MKLVHLVIFWGHLHLVNLYSNLGKVCVCFGSSFSDLDEAWSQSWEPNGLNGSLNS